MQWSAPWYANIDRLYARAHAHTHACTNNLTHTHARVHTHVHVHVHTNRLGYQTVHLMVTRLCGVLCSTSALHAGRSTRVAPGPVPHAGRSTEGIRRSVLYIYSRTLNVDGFMTFQRSITNTATQDLFTYFHYGYGGAAPGSCATDTGCTASDMAKYD